MLVVVIQGSFDIAEKTIQNAVGKADMLEFRLDLFEKNDFETVSKLHSVARLPVMFTLRPVSQGGEFSETESAREQKIEEYLQLNPDYLDLEFGVRYEFVRHVKRKHKNTKIVLSYHNFEETPQELSQILKQMILYNVDIFKMACHANSALDALRMLKFVQHTRQGAGIAIAGMSMGEHGGVTRVLGPVVESALTYAPLDIAGSTAPGQVTVDELRSVYRFHKLNLQTAIFALLGDPVDKSVGHLCHNSVFDKNNINAVYLKIRLQPEEIHDFFHLINDSLPFKGFSVTMPLKEAVIKHLDSTDTLAKASGAVNTLVRVVNKWLGYNTDAKAALDAVERHINLQGKTVLIIGAGGAAKAIAVEASQRGSQVVVSNRTQSKAEELATCVHGKTVSFVHLQAEIPAIIKYDVLINTTSIGMAPVVHAMPISPTQIRQDCVVFDAIWNPKETFLLKTARNMGCKPVFGWEMFVGQALEQEKIWFQGLLGSEKEVLKILEGVVMDHFDQKVKQG